MFSARSCSRSNVVSVPRLILTVIGFVIVLSIPYRSEIKQQWDGSGEIMDWLSMSGSQEGQDFDLASELVSIFEKTSPASSRGSKTISAVQGAKVDAWPAKDDADLMDILDVKPKQVLAMMEAHSEFVKAIDENMPKYIPPQQGPSQGIVTVGGSSYFPPLMVSLRLLRRTGTSLPVEVFIPEDEYEAELCEQVMPALNAFCRPLPSLSGKISHYQFKIFAILLSSFSDVLWLDADNFPLHDAAPLFTSAPFRKTGLVTWPDIWQTSISPVYYLISGKNPTPVTARASTESGQLLVSKAKQWKTLLLVAYYNYYGPSYFYPLLCQGNAGCGDKETFLPAAEAMGLPFYDVKARPMPVGHYKRNSNPENGVYRFALIQADPASDYKVTLEVEETARKPATDEERDEEGGEEGGVNDDTTEPSGEDSPSYDNVPPAFLHMSTPKWDAYHVFDHVSKYDLSLDQRRHPAAAYRDPPEAADRIKGVERMIWEETKWVACNLEDTLAYWEGKRGKICQKFEEYFRETLDVKGAELGLAADDVLAPYIP